MHCAAVVGGLTCWAVSRCLEQGNLVTLLDFCSHGSTSKAQQRDGFEQRPCFYTLL